MFNFYLLFSGDLASVEPGFAPLESTVHISIYWFVESVIALKFKHILFPKFVELFSEHRSRCNNCYCFKNIHPTLTATFA